MTIYADILFLISFVFDAEILIILCKIYSRKIPLLRLLLSACMGGLAGVFAFIPYFGMLSQPPARIILPIIMTALVFMPCKKRMLISAATVFAGVSFMLSGAMNFFGLSAISGLIIPLPIYGIVHVIKKNIRKKRSYVILVYKGRKSIESGFYDSGNMLSSGEEPVILGNRAVFERLFGKGFAIKAISEWVDGCDVRLVPYASLGKQGAILGIRLDYAEIDGRMYYGTILAYTEEDFSEDLILNSVMI